LIEVNRSLLLGHYRASAVRPITLPLRIDAWCGGCGTYTARTLLFCLRELASRTIEREKRRQDA
jgi:hypothetical protein